MALFGAYHGPKEVRYLFIDGAGLQMRLERIGECQASCRS